MRLLEEKKKPVASARERVLLVGLESSGKTTLFSRLTGNRVGEETNVKGSTYSIRLEKMKDYDLVDSPGIKIDDTFANQLVKKETDRASRLILVIRGTQFHDEMNFLLRFVTGLQKPFIVMISHADKMTEKSKQAIKKSMLGKKLPLILTDARRVEQSQVQVIRSFLFEQPRLTQNQLDALQSIRPESILPAEKIFRQTWIGYFAALTCIIAIFLIPVMIAYQISGVMQPLADRFIIQPAAQAISAWPSLLENLLTGSYGLLSLGIYSFVWAFPVVLLIGLSTAIVDETGLKDRMADCLDPLLKRVGLNGQDLVPVLTGFGCNVVAVFQTRNCSACSRKACVSLIGFGSSCSYQIGATLSLFNAANHVWLFLPYVFMLMIGGVLHTRFWYGKRAAAFARPPFIRRSFLQRPTFRGSVFRVKSVVKQFMLQAMPVFMIICILASLLDFYKIIHYLSYLFYPLAALLHLPAEAATGLAFSMIRKDGMLVFNEGQGALLSRLSVSQLFLLIFIASTMTACFVTMWTTARELGFKAASGIMIRQLSTSLVLTFTFSLLWRAGSLLF